MGNLLKVSILAPAAQPFVVPFHFEKRNAATNGEQLVKNTDFGTVCPSFVVPFCFTERNGTTNGWQLIEP